jgi:DNA gyrase/topoisomerase IV subunit A
MFFLPWEDRRMNDDEQAREQLMILECLLQAMDRREEVFRVIEDSEDMDEAMHRVGEVLGVGEIRSQAVLSMQARRFTKDQRRRLEAEVEELRSKLPDRG